jgi:hypothetical protein
LESHEKEAEKVRKSTIDQSAKSVGFRLGGQDFGLPGDKPSGRG